MQKYKVVGGIAKVGQGQVMHLSGQQIKDRAYGLDLPKDYALVAANPKKDKPPKPVSATVTATRMLEFKVGEIIGLPELPSNLRMILEPVDAPKPTVQTQSPAPASVAKPDKTPDQKPLV